MRVRLLALLAGVVLAIAACSAGGPQGPSQPTTSGTVEASMPPSATVSPAQSPPGPGAFVTVAPGAVSVLVDAPSFDTGAPIGAVMANGREDPIFVEDLHTACTIAVLEKQQGSTWSPQPGCGSKRLPQIIEVPPRLGLRISIDPRSIDVEGRAPGSLEPGTYRLSVGWRSTRKPAGLVEHVEHSEAFRIG